MRSLQITVSRTPTRANRRVARPSNSADERGARRDGCGLIADIRLATTSARRHQRCSSHEDCTAAVGAFIGKIIIRVNNDFIRNLWFDNIH